jgi:hypothetical protein
MLCGSIGECLCLKPNWWLGISLFLQPLGGGFLRGAFRMRMICATFHFAGNYPFSMAALNNCVQYFIPKIGNSLRIFPVTRS